MVAVFDNNIDNSDGGIAKEDALLEMLDDYNRKYGTTFQLSTYAKYKKDVAKRLAHKKPYLNIKHDHTQQIDLLIVVSQMLTGYDSKWVNTLYVDKVMKYVDIIQSFSRTNRLFGPDKPFGIIRYYSFPYTMEQNINDALDVYVDRPLGVFVDKLESNLTNINQKFLHIRDIFQAQKIENFAKLPEAREDRNMFAKDFSQMTHLLEAAKLQGFTWDKDEYEFQHGDTYTYVKMELDEQTYLILLQRYRELFEGNGGGSTEGDDFDYPIDTYITETGTGTIDAEYINSKFGLSVNEANWNSNRVKFERDLIAGNIPNVGVTPTNKVLIENGIPGDEQFTQEYKSYVPVQYFIDNGYNFGETDPEKLIKNEDFNKFLSTLNGRLPSPSGDIVKKPNIKFGSDKNAAYREIQSSGWLSDPQYAAAIQYDGIYVEVPVMRQVLNNQQTRERANLEEFQYTKMGSKLNAAYRGDNEELIYGQ